MSAGTTLGLSLLPTQIKLPVLSDAIPQVQVDEALKGDTSSLGHRLEILDDIFTKTDRY